jgi:hypothetical protein
MANYSAGDLYIVDDEFVSQGHYTDKLKQELAVAMTEYIHIMDYILEDQGQQGTYVNALRNFIDSNGLRGLSDRIKDGDGRGYIKWDFEQYIVEIDEADDFLFKA